MELNIIYHCTVDGYKILISVSGAPRDQEAVRKKIAPLLTEKMTDADIERLVEENKVYCGIGPEADYVDEQQGKILQEMLEGAGGRRLVKIEGEYIDNYEGGQYRVLRARGVYIPNQKGVQYWIKQNGVWKKETVEEIGLGLPEEGILQENLTENQQKEISVQQEAARIAGLSAEKKAEEKTARIRAVAAEAINRSQIAELTGEIFNKNEWFNEKKAEIEAVYAVA